MWRQKKYECGMFCEAEIFTISGRTKKFQRAKRVKESCPAQRNLNNKRAQRYFVRLVHSNFTEEDLYLDLTYEGENLPSTRKEVKRDIKNYIERLKRFRKKMGLSPLKYIYVVSNTDNNGNQVRLHCHMIINGMDRDAAERLWAHSRCNSDRLQFDEYGVTGKSLYMARQAAATKEDDLGKGEKTWGYSLGLIKPEPIVSDKAITATMAEKIMRNPEDRALFEKMYAGWTFTDCKIEEDLINGTRFYIRLRKYEDVGKHNRDLAAKTIREASRRMNK